MSNVCIAFKKSILKVMAHAHKIRMQEKKLYMKVPVTVKAVY